MVATEKWRLPKPIKVKRPAWVTKSKGGPQAAIDRAFNVLMASSKTIG
ncbi:hypothetical protein [Nonomuraea sp. NPDC005650]